MANNIPIRIVASLADINTALEDLDINAVNQAGDVRFQLHEQTSLQEALKMTTKTRPGRDGFRLLNPELLNCKLRAKAALDESFNRMLDATIERCDNELRPVEASIAALKVLERYTDQQIPHAGPDLLHRNRGVQHVIYPHPPFPIEPEYEYGNMQQRVPYQPAFATDEERNDATARDRRAQRAIWNAKLRIMEARESILKEKKLEMMTRLRAEYKMLTEEPSDLGIGYAEYENPPLELDEERTKALTNELAAKLLLGQMRYWEHWKQLQQK